MGITSGGTKAVASGLCTKNKGKQCALLIKSLIPAITSPQPISFLSNFGNVLYHLFLRNSHCWVSGLMLLLTTLASKSWQMDLFTSLRQPLLLLDEQMELKHFCGLPCGTKLHHKWIHLHLTDWNSKVLTTQTGLLSWTWGNWNFK